MLNHHSLEAFICLKKNKLMKNYPEEMDFPRDLQKEKEKLNAEEMKLENRKHTYSVSVEKGGRKTVSQLKSQLCIRRQYF